jgi:tRNA 2-selenouridine synthase
MTAEKFLALLIESRLGNLPDPVAIDVRSEGEFKKGALPGFVNAPILNNEERHLVGTSYKTEGKETAIRLGHALVAPNKEHRIGDWLRIAGESKSPVIACWRGGLRSKIACQWITESGREPDQLLGGFKSVRRLLFSELSEKPHRFLVLTGKTGTGKTQLLREIGKSLLSVDLERIAKHRGSAFGLELGDSQPSQVTFENELALELLIQKRRSPTASLEILVEDESTAIGMIRLPKNIKQQITQSEVVHIEATLEERVTAIYEEYVAVPLEKGTSMDKLHGHLRRQLETIRRRLGDERHNQVNQAFESAVLASPLSADSRFAHSVWIRQVLEWYYDPMYEYALERWNRKTAFKGDYSSCKTFLLKKYASLKP